MPSSHHSEYYVCTITLDISFIDGVFFEVDTLVPICIVIVAGRREGRGDDQEKGFEKGIRE